MNAPLPGNDSGGTLPFEGSEEIAGIMEGLIKKWGLHTFIETGTHRGATALWAAQRFPFVITIEADIESFNEAAQNLLGSGVLTMLGDSADALSRITFFSGRTLLYLDAHGGSTGGTPILRELEAIRRRGILPIIAIHDFQVPGHPELGYDKYEDGSELTLPYIQESLNAIGIGHWPVRYNSIPDGAARGFCYIAPE